MGPAAHDENLSFARWEHELRGPGGLRGFARRALVVVCQGFVVTGRMHCPGSDWVPFLDAAPRGGRE